MPHSPGRHLRRRERIEEAPLQGELMLFDPETSKFFVLNRTMSYIWRQCDGEHTEASLLEGLQTQFEGVDRARAAAELKEALETLTTFGLVVDSDDRPT